MKFDEIYPVYMYMLGALLSSILSLDVIPTGIVFIAVLSIIKVTDKPGCV